jgi:hypothetical protein
LQQEFEQAQAVGQQVVEWWDFEQCEIEQY